MRRQKTFLLKLWNDSADSEYWRASLVDLKTNEKQFFASLEKLLQNLDELTQAGLIQAVEESKRVEKEGRQNY